MILKPDAVQICRLSAGQKFWLKLNEACKASAVIRIDSIFSDIEQLALRHHDEFQLRTGASK